MKSFYGKLLIICLWLFSTQNNNAQNSGWYWQSPIPQGNGLHSICFVSTEVGFATGDVGTIIKTTDGGFSWMILNSNVQGDILDIFFLNENIGWAVALEYENESVVIKTTNSGNTWTKHYLGLSEVLNSVFFINESKGWIVGSHSTSLRTTDGGDNWQMFTGGDIEFTDVHFIDENIGIEVGYDTSPKGLIYKSNSGGGSWTLKLPADQGYLYAVKYINQSRVIAIGTNSTSSQGSIMNSFDGGETWNHEYLPNASILNGVDFIDDDVGWIVGTNGDLLKTTNGGTNWLTQSVGVQSSFDKIDCVTESYVYITGDMSVYKTINGGLVWDLLIPKGIINDLNSVFFLNSDFGIAVGDNNTVIKTTNGGIDWIMQTVQYSEHFKSVFFVNQNNGWLVGTNGTILKTTDGATNWDLQNSFTNSDLNSVFFIDSEIGWVIGTGNVFLMTTDGGNNWNYQAPPTYGSWNSISFIDGYSGWIVGNSGKIIHTNNGGLNWEVQYSGITSQLYAVGFFNSVIGWAVGQNGKILKTINGGQNWFEQLSPYTEINFNSIAVLDEFNVRIVGDEGITVSTSDGGENWVKQNRRTNRDLKSTFFISNNLGWTVGKKGTILKTLNSGLTFLDNSKNDSEFPKIFIMEQNYPNPFNPSTVIKCQIPEMCFVLLKVYDTLGNEVTTLVNEEKISGTFEVEFIANNLPSGVYFYKIQAGSFVETKKMVLMK